MRNEDDRPIEPPPVIGERPNLNQPWYRDEDMVVNLFLVSTTKDRQVQWANGLAIAAVAFGPLFAVLSIVLAGRALRRIGTPLTKDQRIARMTAKSAIIAASIFGAMWLIIIGGVCYAIWS